MRKRHKNDPQWKAAQRKAISAAMRALWAKRKADGYQVNLAGVRAMHAKLAAAHGREEWQSETVEQVEAQFAAIEAAQRRKRWAA